MQPEEHQEEEPPQEPRQDFQTALALADGRLTAAERAELMRKAADAA